MVELKSFSWNVAEDLLYRGFNCDSYTWHGAEGDYGNGIWDAFEFATGMVMLPPISGSEGKIYINFNGRTPTSRRDWTIDDGELTGLVDFASNGWYDRTGFGSFRIWFSEIEIVQCRASIGSSPTLYTLLRSPEAAPLNATGAASQEDNTSGSASGVDDSGGQSEPAESGESTEPAEPTESTESTESTGPENTLDTVDVQPESPVTQEPSDLSAPAATDQSSTGGGSMSGALLLMPAWLGLRRRILR